MKYLSSTEEDRIENVSGIYEDRLFKKKKKICGELHGGVGV